MSPSEHPTRPTSGRKHRSFRNVAFPPIVWILVIGFGVLGAGALIALVSPPVNAAWSWQTLGFLLFALSLFIFAAIPGALVALRHPWAGTTTLNTLEQRFNHPRLLGVADVWAGVVAPGWLSVMIVLQFPYALMPITWAVFLVGYGPVFAMLLFDRRRR